MLALLFLNLNYKKWLYNVFFSPCNISLKATFTVVLTKNLTMLYKFNSASCFVCSRNNMIYWCTKLMGELFQKCETVLVHTPHFPCFVLLLIFLFRKQFSKELLNIYSEQGNSGDKKMNVTYLYRN